GFQQPCLQCSQVTWGISDDGRFYCRSCHNVIERTKEVVDTTFTPGSTRISTIGRGTRRRKPEGGRQWRICEGFQFILRNQADALLGLGVSAHFKDQVLLQLWRLYLQKSRQAFTSRPLRSSRLRVQRPGSESDSVGGSSVASASETDADTNASITESCSDWPQGSGSSDVVAYLTARQRRSHGLMNMSKTLALIHLALLWSRESLTLSDLLRLVNEGHVPYVNAFEELPEEMKLEGKDALVFRVESVPSHRLVRRQAQTLLLFLQLQSFPPISRQSLLHPALLSLRYLADANLPDALHPWVCRLMDDAGLVDFTFDATSCPVLPQYDVQTAAVIVVTMKLLFGLDDHTEWDLSDGSGVQPDAGNMFNLRRWFRLTQAALMAAQQKRRHDAARKQWKAKKPLYPSRSLKAVVMKRKRTAEQVQMCFEKLSSRPVGVQRCVPSSFTFCWGDEDGADGPSLHHKTLDRVLTRRHNVQTLSNTAYWHTALRVCDPKKCRSHYSEVEATLPRSFVWLLQLFSFLLSVEPAHLYEEVLKVERRVLDRRHLKGRGRPPGPRTRRSPDDSDPPNNAAASGLSQVPEEVRETQ
ncbi:TATA box-binding protein-associated factor RNA polymerase I subunit B, partial [Limanda limanda]|uniref:TATA box-binding protein-associated factor RNA polymerase I subunit B n=1 Tax=Limanda limanda TaxID=27771 RepID=UPI0029C8B99F